MATMIGNDTQSIIVGSGDDRVAGNLKQASSVSDATKRGNFSHLLDDRLGSISIASFDINNNRNG